MFYRAVEAFVRRYAFHVSECGLQASQDLLAEWPFMGQCTGLHRRTGTEGSGGLYGQYAAQPAGWIYIKAAKA